MWLFTMIALSAVCSAALLLLLGAKLANIDAATLRQAHSVTIMGAGVTFCMVKAIFGDMPGADWSTWIVSYSIFACLTIVFAATDFSTTFQKAFSAVAIQGLIAGLASLVIINYKVILPLFNNGIFVVLILASAALALYSYCRFSPASVLSEEELLSEDSTRGMKRGRKAVGDEDAGTRSAATEDAATARLERASGGRITKTYWVPYLYRFQVSFAAIIVAFAIAKWHAWRMDLHERPLGFFLFKEDRIFSLSMILFIGYCGAGLVFWLLLRADGVLTSGEIVDMSEDKQQVLYRFEAEEEGRRRMFEGRERAPSLEEKRAKPGVEVCVRFLAGNPRVARIDWGETSFRRARRHLAP